MRTILHADLDAFYASVEQLDDPELRGKPVAVGGSPQSRGVVMAASYEARAFGVRSTMPMSQAMRLCPDLARVPARFDRYVELSRKIMAIFRSVTPLVEPLSLDEAFLDVTACVESFGGAGSLARNLKLEVNGQTGLTVSIGAGTNRTVAKIASEQGKPDGLVVVEPGNETAFLDPLPLRALWGIGPKTETVLTRFGMRTIGDIARADRSMLERQLGSRGVMLQEMARGIDDREVGGTRERKSLGAETTFARDLPDGPELREALERIAHEVAERLVRAGLEAKTVQLKLRYEDFTTITRQASRPEPTDDVQEIRSLAEALLSRVAQPGDRFRLLGIQCAGLVEAGKREVVALRLL